MTRRLLKDMVFGMLSKVGVHPAMATPRDEIAGLISRLRPVTCDTQLVRLGPAGDGGYLVPDDLEGVGACFSPGVDTVAGFELDCAERGMDVYMADASVDGPPVTHPKFHFLRKFVGAVSGSGFMRIEDWVAEAEGDKGSELLLQMDIEGYEYEVILGMSDALLARFRVVVVEFHRLNQLWNDPFFRLASRAFDRLLQTHTCVHHHPNNVSDSIRYGGLDIPALSELTFLRNDRIHGARYTSEFPHPLDRDNSDRDSLALPRCWYT